jgi:oligopeptide transport system permease protein
MVIADCRDACDRSGCMRDAPTRAALAWLLLVVLGCTIGSALWPPQFDQVFDGAFAVPPSFDHPLGTDLNGRDVLARTLAGGQISLVVGLLATAVSVAIGVAWGAAAGLTGGHLDALMMRFVDVLFALPFMFLVIVLAAVFGRNFLLFFAAVGAVEWLTMARIVRGQALQMRGREFILAARGLGLTSTAVLWRHVIPNVRGVVIAYTTLTVPQVVLTESFVSFLGLGIQEPMTSWGVLLRQGAAEMFTAPWQLVAPAFLLCSTVLALNKIGEGLRRASEPATTA